MHCTPTYCCENTSLRRAMNVVFVRIAFLHAELLPLMTCSAEANTKRLLSSSTCNCSSIRCAHTTSVGLYAPHKKRMEAPHKKSRRMARAGRGVWGEAPHKKRMDCFRSLSCCGLRIVWYNFLSPKSEILAKAS